MKTWELYEAESGLFLGVRVRCSEDHLAANTRPGTLAIEGEYDHLSQRIDVSRSVRDEAGNLVKHGPVIDYQPPAPSAEHEWNAQAKRWQPNLAVAARAAAQARISELESKQHAHIRHALLGRGGYDQLRDIDDEIERLRAEIQGGTPLAQGGHSG